MLVPYLFWNAVIFCWFLIAQFFLSFNISLDAESVSSYGLVDCLNIFGDYKDGMPACYQFWFIRDLMVVILFSPLVYVLVKYLRMIGLVLLGILWIFDIWIDITGFGVVAFFFFSFGAWYGINRRNFVTDFSRYRLPFTFIYLFFVAASTFVWIKGLTGLWVLHRFGVLFGLVAVVSRVSWGIGGNRLRVNPFLSGSSSFYMLTIGPLLSL